MKAPKRTLEVRDDKNLLMNNEEFPLNPKLKQFLKNSLTPRPATFLLHIKTYRREEITTYKRSAYFNLKVNNVVNYG